MVESATPTDFELITQSLTKDARENFDALDKEQKRDGVFTDWLDIGPLFQAMGIEFETHDEFLLLYNATTKQEVKSISEIKLTKDLYVNMILEKVNQTDPLDGIIAEIESTYDTYESDGDKEMVCLYEDLIKFMEESNWLNASKAQNFKQRIIIL